MVTILMRGKIQPIIGLAAFLILLFASHGSFGQTISEDDGVIRDKWITDLNVWPEGFLRPRYDRYTSVNLDRFKNILQDIESSPKTTDWEGTYWHDRTELGTTQLRLRGSAYVTYYVYSCFPELRWISYGNVTDFTDTVQTEIEFNSVAPLSRSKTTHVKVFWGNRRYLVEESSLAAFAEKAAGIFVEPESMDHPNFEKWSNYWVNGIFEEPLLGLPTFPSRYAHLARQPIHGEIVYVGKPSKKDDFEIKTANSTQYFSKAVLYAVSVNRGKNQGVKTGMIFYLPATDDTVYIKSVGATKSVGFVIRYQDESGGEDCVSESGETQKCKPIRVRMKVQTSTGEF